MLNATGFTCADIVMQPEPGTNDDACRNDAFSRGVNMSHPAAQAFYDSLAELWTEWGTDVVKVDCNRMKWMGAREEIFGMASAFERAAASSHRPITYILSPGGNAVCGGGCGACSGPKKAARSIPCNPSLRCNASTLWRTSLFRMDHGIDGNWVNGSWVIPTSDSSVSVTGLQAEEESRVSLGDVHDRWSRDIINMFPVCAAWAAHRQLPHGLYGKGARAYIDMLPVGEMSSLTPRGNKMTASQQKVAFTLWSVFGAPLVLGTSLIRMSSEMLTMVTNKEVIAMARESVSSRQHWWHGVQCGGTGKHSGVPCAATVAWEVLMPAGWRPPTSATHVLTNAPATAAVRYYALFNLGPANETLRVETGADGPLFDVWEQRSAGATTGGAISVEVAANSTVLLRML